MGASRSLYIALRGDIGGLRSDMNSAVGVLKNTEKEVLGIAKNIKSVLSAAFVVSGAYGIAKLAGEIKQLAQAGDQLGDLEAGFKSLGGRDGVITEASKSSAGLISDINLLKAATQGLARQIPGLNSHFSELSEYAAKFGQATGKDVTETLNNLIAAIARGKPALLNKLGITIDQTAAYKKQAESLGLTIDAEGKWQNQLSDTEKKLAIQNAALEELKKKKEQLPKLILGVADAFDALSNTWENSIGKLGKEIDANTSLSNAIVTLKDTLESVDWAGIGDAIALMLSALALGAKGAAAAVNDLTLGLRDQKFQTGLWGIWDFLKGGSPTTDYYKPLFDDYEKKKKEFDQQRAAAEASARQKADAEAAIEAERRRKQYEEEAARLAQQAKQASEAWAKTQNDFSKQDLGKQIKQAIEGGDLKAFEDLKAQFQRAAYEGILAGIANIGKPGGPSEAEAEAFAQRKAEFEASTYNVEMQKAIEKRGEAEQDVIKKQLEDQKKAYEESVNFFRDLFSEAIDTGTIDLGKRLKEVAIEFAANLAAGLTGLSFDPKNIGASLAQALIGRVSGGSGTPGGGLVGGLLGAGGLADAGSTISGFATGFSGASFGPVASGAEYGGMLSGASTAAFLSNPVTIAAAAAVAIGMIGQKQGWWGNHKPQNPDTKARNTVESFLEDKTGRNFVFGDIHKFDNGKGFDAFKGMKAGDVSFFSAFGEGLKDTLGITENIGPQIGAILAENLNGNVDKAKGLFKELGVSAEDMAQAVIKAGLKAGQTWQQITGELDQIDRLAKPGLDKLGDTQGAYQGIIDSGAKGLEATSNLVALAIEAQEKGFTSLAQLQADLKKTNDPAEVDKLFAALDKRGIKTLDQLATASIRTAGAVIGDLQGMAFAFKEVADSVNEATDSMAGFNDALSQTDIPGASKSSSVPKLAAGGIVRRPTLSLIGEAGPEAVIPLSRMQNFSAGSMMGGSVYLHVDARGASSGVSQEIHTAIQQYIPAIVNKSVGQVYDIARRGGAISRAL